MIIEEINKEITELQQIAEKIKQKIYEGLEKSKIITGFVPINDYLAIKRLIKDYLEIKHKILTQEKETKKSQKQTLFELLDKLNTEQFENLNAKNIIETANNINENKEGGK